MLSRYISTQKHKILFCTLLIIISIQTYSKSEKDIDSLKKAITLQTDKKKLASIYNDLAKLYVLSDFDSASYYYDKALMLADSSENKKLTTEILLNLSKLQAKQSNFEESKKNCNSAIKLASELKNDSLLIEGNLLLARIKVTASDFSGVLSLIDPAYEKAKSINDSLLVSECYDAYGTYYYFSDITLAVDYYIKSLRIIEKYADKENILSRIINIGSLYGRIGRNDKAIEYLLRGAKIAKKQNQNYVISTIYNNLAVIYFNENNTEKSKYYLEEALKLARSLKDDPMICGILVNLGELYQGEKQFDVAMDYYSQGMNNPAIENLPDQKIYTLHNIATLYYDLKNYPKAIKYAEEALALAKKTDVTIHDVIIYQVLSEAYEKAHDYKKALENQKLYKSSNDSLFNIQNTEKIAEIQSKYDFDKSESENNLLKKDNQIQALTIQRQNNRLGLLIVILFLILSLTVAGYLKIKKDKKTNALLSSKNNEIKRKSKELEDANMAKDKFFSILAHDLRNPFNSIVGSLEILKDSYEDLSKEERIEFIELIYKSAQSTNKLLTNLLEWSRTQRGGMELHQKTNNISAIVKEAINLHQNQALKKEIEVENKVQENLNGFFDKKTIAITINNLISNAIKFTNNKGKVTVSSSQINGHLSIRVEDTGIGISEEAIKSLFKIEVSQSNPGTDSEPGTGLGLILCKEFVEKNNGSIHVSSEVGKGSCFEISLPGNS